MKWLTHLSTRKSTALVETLSFPPSSSLRNVNTKTRVSPSIFPFPLGARSFSTHLPYTCRNLPTPRHLHRGVLHIPPSPIHIRSYNHSQGLSHSNRCSSRAMSSAANLVESAKKLAA